MLSKKQTMKDLESIDPEFYNSLVWIKYVPITAFVVLLYSFVVKLPSWFLVKRLMRALSSEYQLILLPLTGNLTSHSLHPGL